MKVGGTVKITKLHIKWAGQNYLHFKAQAAKHADASWQKTASAAYEALLRLYEQLENRLCNLIAQGIDGKDERLVEADRWQALATVYLRGRKPTAHVGREYIGVVQCNGTFLCRRFWMVGDSPTDDDEILSRVEEITAKDILDLIKVLRKHKTQEIWLKDQAWRKIA